MYALSHDRGRWVTPSITIDETGAASLPGLPIWGTINQVFPGSPLSLALVMSAPTVGAQLSKVRVDCVELQLFDSGIPLLEVFDLEFNDNPSPTTVVPINQISSGIITAGQFTAAQPSFTWGATITPSTTPIAVSLTGAQNVVLLSAVSVNTTVPGVGPLTFTGTLALPNHVLAASMPSYSVVSNLTNPFDLHGMQFQIPSYTPAVTSYDGSVSGDPTCTRIVRTVVAALYVATFSSAGVWSVVDPMVTPPDSFDVLDYATDQYLVPNGIQGDYSSRSIRLKLPCPILLAQGQALVVTVSIQSSDFITPYNFTTFARSRMAVLS